MNQQSWIFPKKKNYNVNEEREYLKISCFIWCCKKKVYQQWAQWKRLVVFFFFVVKEVFCQPVERFWMRKENHLRRLISTLIQTLPAAFVANRALSIRKLNRFFFHIKVLHIRTHEKYEGKKTTKKLFANEIYITSFVIRLFHLSGISWDRHENEANPFKVVICEKIKILIQNHLVEDLMN